MFDGWLPFSSPSSHSSLADAFASPPSASQPLWWSVASFSLCVLSSVVATTYFFNYYHEVTCDSCRAETRGNAMSVEEPLTGDHGGGVGGGGAAETTPVQETATAAARRGPQQQQEQQPQSPLGGSSSSPPPAAGGPPSPPAPRIFSTRLHPAARFRCSSFFQTVHDRDAEEARRTKSRRGETSPSEAEKKSQ